MAGCAVTGETLLLLAFAIFHHGITNHLKESANRGNSGEATYCPCSNKQSPDNRYDANPVFVVADGIGSKNDDGVHRQETKNREKHYPFGFGWRAIE